HSRHIAPITGSGPGPKSSMAAVTVTVTAAGSVMNPTQRYQLKISLVVWRGCEMWGKSTIFSESDVISLHSFWRLSLTLTYLLLTCYSASLHKSDEIRNRIS